MHLLMAQKIRHRSLSIEVMIMISKPVSSACHQVATQEVFWSELKME